MKFCPKCGSELSPSGFERGPEYLHPGGILICQFDSWEPAAKHYRDIEKEH
jgi:hypothetical protein